MRSPNGATLSGACTVLQCVVDFGTPLWGSDLMRAFRDPGRRFACPGLTWGCPFGAEELASIGLAPLKTAQQAKTAQHQNLRVGLVCYHCWQLPEL